MPRTKEVKDVFVIMPFSRTPTRNKTQLTAFFENQIKDTIERTRFLHRYRVHRSDDTFNITEKIITDLYHADIVICDLSGTESNANVMYELGIRLAFSDRPVILIREGHKDNKTIFDISGFYAHTYDPLDYNALMSHLRSKIKGLEDGSEVYRSPVLTIVKQDIPLIQTISVRRADQLLDAMSASLKTVSVLFSRDLIAYISSHSKKVKFPKQLKEISELLVIVEANSGILNALDWSDFRWQFGSQPTIDHYLSNQYLYDLVPEDIERHFTAFVVVYHAHFVSTTYYQGGWKAGAVHKFLGETEILMNLIRGMRVLLSGPENRKDIIKKMWGSLSGSHLLQNNASEATSEPAPGAGSSAPQG